MEAESRLDYATFRNWLEDRGDHRAGYACRARTCPLARYLLHCGRKGVSVEGILLKWGPPKQVTVLPDWAIWFHLRLDYPYNGSAHAVTGYEAFDILAAIPHEA
jgi:hypothetical protein